MLKMSLKTSIHTFHNVSVQIFEEYVDQCQQQLLKCYV